MLSNLIFYFFKTIIFVYILKKYINQQIFYTIIFQLNKPHPHKHNHNQCNQYGCFLAFNTILKSCKSIGICRKLLLKIVYINLSHIYY